MADKDSDIFELTNTGFDFNNNKAFWGEEENPFLSRAVCSDSARRLNDYDSNILKDGAYKDINDDTFKLEYKISKTEKEISLIEAQISTAKEINDFNKIEELNSKLAYLRDEYKTLLELYNEKTLSAKITYFSSNIINKIFGKNKDLNNSSTSLYDVLISKMPRKISSILKIKKSLNMLENINKSVDELVTMTVPYGENIDKYQQLSKYIIKANAIQSEISSYLKKN